MAITEVSNYAAYKNYYTNTKQKSSSEVAKNTTDKQITSRTYSSVREYKTYLTEKYDCLKSSDYSVAMNSSLLSEATRDEKTAKWLEYNLSLIPECVEKMKSAAAARGSELVSCNITINGYDSITSETCTRSEADPGTEKAREDLEERIKKIKEEKKAEQRAEKKAAEQYAQETRTEKLISDEITVTVMGNSVKSVSESILAKMSVNTGTLTGSFDVKA